MAVLSSINTFTYYSFKCHMWGMNENLWSTITLRNCLQVQQQVDSGILMYFVDPTETYTSFLKPLVV